MSDAQPKNSSLPAEASALPPATVTGSSIAPASKTLPPIPAGWPPGYPWPPPPPAGAPPGWQPPGGFTGYFPPGAPMPPGWPSGYAWPPGSKLTTTAANIAPTLSPTVSFLGGGHAGQNQIIVAQDSSTMNIGVILGIVIGALIAVLAIGVLLWMRQKGLKRNSSYKRTSKKPETTSFRFSGPTAENALLGGSLNGSSSNAETRGKKTAALPTPEFMIAALLAANPKPRASVEEEKEGVRRVRDEEIQQQNAEKTEDSEMETNEAGGMQQPVTYSHPQKGSQENMPSETEENPCDSIIIPPAVPQPPPTQQTPLPIQAKLFSTMEAVTTASSATPTPAESPPEYQVFSQSSTSTLIQLEAQPTEDQFIMNAPIGYGTHAPPAPVAQTEPPTQETPAEEQELHWFFFRTRRGGRITVAAVVVFLVILFSVLGAIGAL
ncbi:hypothetical protein HDU98_007106 [Podochytrium sp. JEL0797]|nr:hypothetical protein HDU98_007106 [Podochytrium sp. JEL0797]